MAKGKFIEFLIRVFKDSFDRLLDEGGDGVEKLLEDGYAKEPGLTTELIPVLYKYWDTIVENYVARTKTKVDDKIVLEVKQAVERFAAAHDITLPNVDEGQPGD